MHRNGKQRPNLFMWLSQSLPNCFFLLASFSRASSFKSLAKSKESRSLCSKAKEITSTEGTLNDSNLPGGTYFLLNSEQLCHVMTVLLGGGPLRITPYRVLHTDALEGAPEYCLRFIGLVLASPVLFIRLVNLSQLPKEL